MKVGHALACPQAVFETDARSILSPTSGFIAEAGFTHSLTPARNCTFGCTYCYVPTMGVYGGLKPDDWTHWGQFTTFKSNAAELLRKSLRANQKIYCSPLVDPYQPAEEARQLMPAILDAVIETPPLVFTIQTRGPVIVRDFSVETAIFEIRLGSNGKCCQERQESALTLAVPCKLDWS